MSEQRSFWSRWQGSFVFGTVALAAAWTPVYVFGWNFLSVFGAMFLYCFVSGIGRKIDERNVRKYGSI